MPDTDMQGGSTGATEADHRLGPAEPGEASPTVERVGEVLRFSGALTTGTADGLWARTLREAIGASVLDLSGLTALDTTGATLLLHAAEAAPGARIEGAGPSAQAVLTRIRGAAAPAPAAGKPRSRSFVGSVGAWGVGLARDSRDGATFLGASAATVFNAARRPRDLRFSELLRHLDEVGTRSFPLVALLGVLVGLILAFQSSVPMRQFGAEIFIPRLVGLSLLRELGPLLAGVILAGRTGSAFAAELGTMTVNEEIDALRTMGIDPMVLLVLPRLLAATLAMPAMTLLMDLAGLLGMTGVMASLGYPPVLVADQILAGVGLGDLWQGLFKAAAFGLVIAGVGCRAGLATGRGPRAVGDSTTAAVVGGIVAIVLLDGLFAVLFFRLGI